MRPGDKWGISQKIPSYIWFHWTLTARSRLSTSKLPFTVITRVSSLLSFVFAAKLTVSQSGPSLAYP